MQRVGGKHQRALSDDEKADSDNDAPGTPFLSPDSPSSTLLTGQMPIPNQGLTSKMASKSDSLTSSRLTDANSPKDVDMNDTSKHLVDELQEALFEEAPRGKFATGGQIAEDLDRTFTMTVDGFGEVTLPILATNAQQLIRLAKPSPFGKKDTTIYDKHVRNSWQLEPSQVHLSEEWLAKLHSAVFPQLNTELGLCMEQSTDLELHLYKLLLYERGGHFSTHRDSEKERDMFGTLIVVLPCEFGGGTLLVHQGDWMKAFIDADAIKRTGRSEWVAFYSDCEHELKPVTEGYRVALSFNMVRKRKKMGTVVNNVDVSKVNAIVKILTNWIHGDYHHLGIMLEHHYTHAFLESATALKGVDKNTQALIQAAVAALNTTGTIAAASSAASINQPDFMLTLQLCQVKVEESGYFNDEDNESDRETLVRDIYASDFTPGSYLEMLLGAKGRLQLNLLVLPPSVKEDQIFEEDVEHTGNEGTNFERWYYRTAILLVDTNDPWGMVCRNSIHRATKLFAEAVKELAAGASTFTASPIGRIITASGKSASSSFMEVANFASSISTRLQQEAYQNNPKDRPFYGYSWIPSSKEKADVHVPLDFTNDLLRFRKLVCRYEPDAVQRVDFILEEFIQAQCWFPRMLQMDSSFCGPVSELLVELLALSERHVKNWLQARSKETLDQIDFFIQLAKLPHLQTQELRQSSGTMTLDGSLKVTEETSRQLHRVIEEAALACCLRPVCKTKPSTPTHNEPSAMVTAHDQRTNEVALQLPTVNELASQCTPERLLQYVECLVFVACEHSSSSVLTSTLSSFVDALQYKAPSIEFIRKDLYKTLMIIARNGKASGPIQPLYTFAVMHLQRHLQKVVMPGVGMEWKYPAAAISSSCHCERCIPIWQFLNSNDCVYSYKAAEKDRRHVSNHWCGYSSYSQNSSDQYLLAGETIRYGSPQTLILRKKKSNMERIHQRCQADAEILLDLHRAFIPGNSAATTSSKACTEKDVTSILPYNISDILARITQLRTTVDAQFQTLQKNYVTAATNAHAKKKEKARTAKRAKLS